MVARFYPLHRPYNAKIFVAILLLLVSCTALAIASSSMTPLKPPTIIVTGATGKVGSRLVRQLCKGDNDVQVVALVRNADKARSIFGTHLLPSLTVLEADYANADQVKSALDSVDSSNAAPCRLFLACGNVPNQAELELNVLRSAKEKGVEFCVKLSTAHPVMKAKLASAKEHTVVEYELTDGESKVPHCILRPNMFMQVLSSASFLGVNLRDSDEAGHPLADSDMSVIDCEDVAACAAAVLTSEDPVRRHDGKIYELTGPEAVRLSDRLVGDLSYFRPRKVHIEAVALEESLEASGVPAAAAGSLGPFLDTLGAYSRCTSDVKLLTGRPARSITDFVRDDPTPFLPKTFQRLVARGKAPSFREAARVMETSLDEVISELADDEVLIRVQAAGVNGGADTFACTRASPDAKDFPLGNEGTGPVVIRGKSVSRFHPGDTAVFVANGAYSEYVVAKESRCAYAPSDVRASPSELTALRISALTALVALNATQQVRRGDVVLVTACCGGTGHFAVQIAKRLGATVIGTVGSTAKVTTAKELGVDRVIDLSQEKLADVLENEYSQGIDIAYEGVGGPLLRDIYNNLAEGGVILVVGSISQYPHNSEATMQKADIDGLNEDIMDIFRSGKTVELDHGRKIIGNVWGGLIGSDQMPFFRDKVYEMFFKGELKPIVESMPASNLENVCDAVEHMLSRKSIGKVCVVISE